MIALFVQKHSICLICQAQRGFFIFLTVNLGPPTSVGSPNLTFRGHETIDENRLLEIAGLMPQGGYISLGPCGVLRNTDKVLGYVQGYLPQIGENLCLRDLEGDNS